MNEPKGRIPIEQLEDRRIYIIRSRNLVVGAWNAGSRGFIGVREKLRDEYLFTEYEWDTSTRTGTAYAVEATEHVVPAEVTMVEYFRSEAEHAAKTNRPLFDILKPMSDAERERRIATEGGW